MSTQTLDSLCTINPETLGTSTPMDFEFRYPDISAVTKGRIDWSATRIWKFADAPSRARRRLRSGDVLLCTVRPGLQAHARIQGDEPLPVVGSTGFALLRPNVPTDSGFIFHQLFSNGIAAQLSALETGSSYPAVNESDVRRILVFAPEVEERRHIAAVLDTVDEAIAKTEAVIAKLKQVRAGLLHDLLTRGLDEHGQLRDPIAHHEQFQDSPLGWIPREWDVGILNDLVPTDRPIVYGILMPGRGFRGGVPVIKVKDIKEGRIDTSDLLLTDPRIDEAYRRSRVLSGDLLFTIRGTVGRMAILPPELENANITQDTARISLVSANPVFVARWLEMEPATRYVSVHTIGVAVRGINVGDVRRIPIPIIPRPEQDAIAASLEAHEAQMGRETATLGKLILLKSGLMTDLLTGRVRVPESISAAENQP